MCRAYVGAEPLAREHVAARGSRPDLGQHERGDDGRDDPELDLGEPERRVPGGKRDVCTGREPAAAAEAVALDPGYDRRGTAVDRREHLVEPERVLDVLLIGQVDRGALPLDVRAGAEALSLAGEHDRPGIADVRESLRQLADEVSVEGVSAFGLVDGDAEDMSVPLDAQRAHARELRVGAC